MEFKRKFFEERGNLAENAKEKEFIVFLEKIAEQKKAEGVPLTNDCRIDMDAFSEIYPGEIEKDKKEIEIYKKEWDLSFPPEKPIDKDRDRTAGEKLEILKTVLFSKFLSVNFITVRASVYDDVKNGIDNVIIEKETGNIVCAFDEVADTTSEYYLFKKDDVLKRNTKGGGNLKYGLKIEGNKLSLGRLQSAPIFFLALSSRHINEGIKNLIPSLDEKSDYETKLFKYFISSLDSQYRFLKLEARLDSLLRERLDIFKKTIDQFTGAKV